MSQVIVQPPPNLAAPLSRATQSSRVSIALASEYGRCGYRRITVKLREAGWQVGTDRVQRIWRREGLRVPQKQRPRGRLWFNDGSCVRLRSERANHVWSYDFVSAMTHDGRTLRLLKEAQVVIEQWRVEYNTRRPHSALGPTSTISRPEAVM
jgi:transposase InsO family protein